MAISLYAGGGVLTACSGGSTVYVKNDLQNVVIEADTGAVNVGETITLKATVTPSDAYYESITWNSSDETAFEVANGGLTAYALGVTGSSSAEFRTSKVSVTIDGKTSEALELRVYDENVEIPEDQKTPAKTGGTVVTPGGTAATGTQETPTAADVSNDEIKIVKSEGWFNSAYVIFEQHPGAASYEVLCDDVKLDNELIRSYGTYTYKTPVEDASTLAVTYKETTLSNVVRADALGLKKGTHTIKVRALGAGDSATAYSTATMTVVDHDRSGFAFANGREPGAYKLDGTLKDGAIVIYLTKDNVNTVKATFTTAKGKTNEYTGVQDITQAIKSKDFTTPVDIRVIGSLYATKSGELSCKDLASAWALGVKGAANVTIEGVGHDATLYGAGLAAFQSENIELANFGLMKWGGGKDGDGISLKADSYVWVHHNDVFYGDAGSDGDQVKGDGSMDLKDDSNHIAITYNHFWDSGKMSLCGMKSESGPNYITYHHNWFDHSDSRHPRIRTMTVHVYNNYFDGNSKYGVGVTTGASCFVEGNFFRDAHDPMMSSMQGTDAAGGGTFSGEKGGVIKSYNNKFEQNNLYQKFQFITNKYDYTNNVALPARQQVTETKGTANGDGTYTIYDSKVNSSVDEIATNGLIAAQCSASGGKYQVKKASTGFILSVPSNTTKVIVKAKCGSSNKSGTADMLSVNGTKVQIDMTSDYQLYEVAISSVSNNKIEIANVHKENAMNVQEIKVIASSEWTTTYWIGADLTDIDAYEVDSRNEIVPDDVTAKVGGTTYSNFDVTLGDSGMGVTVAPTDPDDAKAAVIGYSGRHESDFAFAFNNSEDDASYAKNDALNTALLNYKTQRGLTSIQGE